MDAQSHISLLMERVSHARNEGVPDSTLPEFVAMCAYEAIVEMDEMLTPAKEDAEIRLQNISLVRVVYSWSLDFVNLYAGVCGCFIDPVSVLRAMALMLDQDEMSLSVQLYIMERGSNK